MPSGVYKRSKIELERIRKLRIDKIPWNKNKPWNQQTKILISKHKKERDKQTKKEYLEWLISDRKNSMPIMPGKKRLLDGKNPYYRVKDRKGNDYPEHRLMIELLLNCRLKKNEIVHHINGKMKDNRIENLCLFEKEKYHLSYHNGWLKNIKQKPSMKSLIEYASSNNLIIIKVIIGLTKSLLIVRENLTR